MGAYSAWLSGLLSDRVRPARVALDRTLLLADFEPEPTDLERLLGGIPRAIALPIKPEHPLAGVDYFRFRTNTNPIQWDGEAEQIVRRPLDTVAFLVPPSEIHGQTLLDLRRLGVRRVLLPGRRGLKSWSPLRLAMWRKLGTVGRKALHGFGIAGSDEMSEAECRRILARAAPRRSAPPPDRPLRIVYFLNSLSSGGADAPGVPGRHRAEGSRA